VDRKAYDTVVLLGTKGGWEEMSGLKKGGKPKATTKAGKTEAQDPADEEVKPKSVAKAEEQPETSTKPAKPSKRKNATKKVKEEVSTKEAGEDVEVKVADTQTGTRRSKRVKK